MRLEFIKNINDKGEHVLLLSDFDVTQALMLFGMLDTSGVLCPFLGNS